MVSNFHGGDLWFFLQLAKIFGVSETPLNSPQSSKSVVDKKLDFNFMEEFMADLKTFLGLAMPNQSCLDVTN